MLHARLRHQCSLLHSDIFRINITNDSHRHCGSSFKDSNLYVKECPLHQSEKCKMKCKGHNLFFQIDTFLDSDFSTLISNGNTFQFSQDFCAKSSGKLTCLIPREISIMVIPHLKSPVVTSFLSFLPCYWDKDNHTIFCFCAQHGWAS